jgi:hypothetical protein
MRVRPYRPSDLAACLATFSSNVPTFFTAAEQTQFAKYLSLKPLPGTYLVLDDDAAGIAGCGGWAPNRDDTSITRLTWGMVTRSRHRTGLGRLLLRARLAAIATRHEIASIEMSTSQHTCEFYVREGFTIDRAQKNFLAPGLDQIDMSLTCTAPWRHAALDAYRLLADSL